MVASSSHRALHFSLFLIPTSNIQYLAIILKSFHFIALEDSFGGVCFGLGDKSILEASYL